MGPGEVRRTESNTPAVPLSLATRHSPLQQVSIYILGYSPTRSGLFSNSSVCNEICAVRYNEDYNKSSADAVIARHASRYLDAAEVQIPTFFHTAPLVVLGRIRDHLIVLRFGSALAWC